MGDIAYPIGVLSDVEMSRPKQSFEDSVVYGDLKYWGYFKGLQYAADGYPAESAIAHIMTGSSPFPGHKVLVLDMTPRAWQINARVMLLPRSLVEVVVGRFCLPVKADTGALYTANEIADVLGIHLRTYFDRLRVARDRYRRSVFGELAFARAEITV